MSNPIKVVVVVAVIIVVVVVVFVKEKCCFWSSLMSCPENLLISNLCPLCLRTTMLVLTSQPIDQPRYRVQGGSWPNNNNVVNTEGQNTC